MGDVVRLRGIHLYGDRWRRTFEKVLIRPFEKKRLSALLGVMRRCELPRAEDQRTYLLPDAETVYWQASVDGTALMITYGFDDEYLLLVAIRRGFEPRNS